MLIVLVNNGVIALSGPIGFVIFGIGGFAPAVAAIAIHEKRTPKAIVKYIFSGNLNER